jgi:hypothetical protein
MGNRPALQAFTSALLCGLLGAPQVWAQEAEGPKALNIVIVEGEGAINNVRQRVAREPIVQVQDENHKPVAGAIVVFLLPSNGPSGTFTNGSNSLTVVTGPDGRARAIGLRPNAQNGSYQMRITASYKGLTASQTLNMSNAILSTGLAAAKIWTIVAIVGAAAAGAAVLVTQTGGGGPPASTPPATATPGTIVVGPPR